MYWGNNILTRQGLRKNITNKLHVSRSYHIIAEIFHKFPKLAYDAHVYPHTLIQGGWYMIHCSLYGVKNWWKIYGDSVKNFSLALISLIIFPLNKVLLIAATLTFCLSYNSVTYLYYTSLYFIPQFWLTRYTIPQSGFTKTSQKECWIFSDTVYIVHTFPSCLLSFINIITVILHWC